MKLFIQLSIIISCCFLFSCRTEPVPIVSDLNDFYRIENKEGILEFDKDLNLTVIKPHLSKEFVTFHVEENTIKKAVYILDNNEYIVWLDSDLSPMYFNKKYLAQKNDVFLKEVNYQRSSNREVLDIGSRLELSQNLYAALTDQYLEFENNKIDHSKSIFYTISKSDSGSYFNLNIPENYDKNIYHLIYCYTDPVSSLTPIEREGNLYYKETEKIKYEILFHPEDKLSFRLEKGFPTTFQLYSIDSRTNKAIDYKINIVNKSINTVEKIYHIKDTLSRAHDNFSNLEIKDLVRKTINKFQFISMDKEIALTVDKVRLKNLINRYH